MNGDNLNRYILIKINNFYSYNIYFKLLLSEVSTLFCLWAHKLSLDQPSWRGREPCSLLISLEGFYSFATCYVALICQLIPFQFSKTLSGLLVVLDFTITIVWNIRSHTFLLEVTYCALLAMLQFPHIFF